MFRRFRLGLLALGAFALAGAGYAGGMHANTINTATLTAQLTASEATTVTNIGSATFVPNIQGKNTFTDGTGTGKVNILWTASRTIAASGKDSFDLSGVLTNTFGTALSMTAVKGLIIVANAANTNNVVVGGAAAATWVGPFGDATDKIVVKPGGFFAVGVPGTGYTVTNTTADALVITNSAGTTGVSYQIGILSQ